MRLVVLERTSSCVDEFLKMGQSDDDNLIPDHHNGGTN